MKDHTHRIRRCIRLCGRLRQMSRLEAKMTLRIWAEICELGMQEDASGAASPVLLFSCPISKLLPKPAGGNVREFVEGARALVNDE
jgi:hypothetical protein